MLVEHNWHQLCDETEKQGNPFERSTMVDAIDLQKMAYAFLGDLLLQLKRGPLTMDLAEIYGKQC
jgi:hypothetical protein